VNKSLCPLILGLAVSSAVAQVPCFDTNLGTNLALIDDSFSAILPLGFSFTYGGVAYTDVQVCSNGYIVFGTGTPGIADYTPSVAELTGNPEPRVCPMWMDFNPALNTNGGVFANAVPAAGSVPAYFTVTWNDVFEFAGSTPHTLQIAIIAGGSMQFAYGTNLASNANTWLIGASPGNGALANAVSFTALPIVSAGPTLHETATGALPIAASNNQWIPGGLGYVVTPAANCASRQDYGAGCVSSYASFYEWFTSTAAIDLSNTALTMLYTGSGYIVLPGTTTFVAPSGTATNLMLGDDTTTAITLSAAVPYPGGSASSLTVCSNGFVSTASNGASYTPTPSAMLAWANTAWSVWRDFFPTAAGADNVYFEEVGGIGYVTWLNVRGYVGLAQGTTPSTFQFQFEVATGNVHIVFQGMDTVSLSGWTGGEGWVVGYSPGGASADPGGVDLTAVLGTILIGTADVVPLGLTASTLPTLGAAVSLDVVNIPAGTPFGAVLFGLNNPSIPLAGIGMPGCTQYTDGISSALFFLPASSVVLNIPASSAFVGVHILNQGATFSPGSTPLGFLASNGVDLGIGN